MMHLEHANTKEKYTMLKQAVRDAETTIRQSKTEFCTLTQERYNTGIFNRAKGELASFEKSSPEVLI